MDDFEIDEVIKPRSDDYIIRTNNYDGTDYYGLTKIECLIAFDVNGQSIQYSEIRYYKNEASAKKYYDDLMDVKCNWIMELDGAKLIVTSFIDDTGVEDLKSHTSNKFVYSDMNSTYFSMPYLTYQQYLLYVNKSR